MSHLTKQEAADRKRLWNKLIPEEWYGREQEQRTEMGLPAESPQEFLERKNELTTEEKIEEMRALEIPIDQALTEIQEADSLNQQAVEAGASGLGDSPFLGAITHRMTQDPRLHGMIQKAVADDDPEAEVPQALNTYMADEAPEVVCDALDAGKLTEDQFSELAVAQAQRSKQDSIEPGRELSDRELEQEMAAAAEREGRSSKFPW